MATTNSNNATWYMLRYAADFAPRASVSESDVPPQMVPPETPTLLWDDSRHVLELLPVKSATELTPPPGLALDLDGEIYFVDPATGQLMVRFCDGSQRPLLCECGILSQPAGLALDRRGFLYVADPGLRRVIVLRPDDGSSVAILRHGLTEPVDVAIAPSGTIYVADRTGGKIVTFTARFSPRSSFVPQDAQGLPTTPRPVAVMVDADGSILVADANHPRLLRFDPHGRPLGDVIISTLLMPVQAMGISPANLQQLLVGPAGKFVAGACCSAAFTTDGAQLLARNQLYLRLLALKLSHSYAPSGQVLSAVLDSHKPGTIWHKLILGADLPAGTSITVETATAESPEALTSQITIGSLVGSDLSWASAQRANLPIPFSKEVPDQLIQSKPGRYLRLRITLTSDGSATPSLGWLKVLYPRVSYLDSLPRIYQRDPEAQLFLQQYLALFERVLTGIEDRYELFTRWLNPKAAPIEWVNWLGLLLDLSFDPSWPLEKRRALVAEAVSLYAIRGTIAGLKRYIEIYTGLIPQIIEAFRNRPSQPSFLGIGQSVLGCNIALTPPSETQTPQSSLGDAYAHRFTVLLYLNDDCAAETLLPVVDRIVTVNKPAHTIHTLQAIYPAAQVGMQSTVGVDLVVGGSSPPNTQLGGADQPGLPATGHSVLGVDSVLGNQRPQYPSPFPDVL